MSTSVARKAAKREQRGPADTIGGEGRPINDYIGWDDAAGVVRKDNPALHPRSQARRHGGFRPTQGFVHGQNMVTFK